MKTFLRYFFIVLIILGVTACSTIKDPRFISIENVEVKTVGESFYIITDLEMYNPNKFALHSKDVDIELFIDKLFIGNVSLLSEFKVKKLDTLKLRSRLILEPKLFKNKISLKDTLNLRAKGSTKVSFIPLNYKFDIKQNLILSDLLEPLIKNKLKNSDFNFKSIQLENIRLSSVDIESALTFNNNFNFDYSIEKLNIEIYDSKKHNNLIGESNINNPIKVEKQSEAEIVSNISLNTAKLGKSILKNLLKKRHSLFVKVNAIIDFNKIQIPLTMLKELEYNPITQEIFIKQ
jgi:LEA14-like dessication related protein